MYLYLYQSSKVHVVHGAAKQHELWPFYNLTKVY